MTGGSVLLAEEVVKIVVELVKLYESKGPINYDKLEADVKTIIGTIKQYFPKGVSAPASIPAAVIPAVEGKPQ
jgi:hypothetical protein